MWGEPKCENGILCKIKSVHKLKSVHTQNSVQKNVAKCKVKYIDCKY
jgi:hypothetical protein